MKKILFLTTLFLLFTQNSSSEIHPHALGIRSISGYMGFGGEISYQHALGDANRLELDFGLSRNRGNAFGYNERYGFIVATAIYHWVNEIGNDLSWYYGIGAQAINYSSYRTGIINNGYSFGVGGQIGIEYDLNALDVPFQASLDMRPMWILGNRIRGYTLGSALSLRYTF